MDFKLSVLPEVLAICRLDRKATIPDWALRISQFGSITASSEEISTVCDESTVQENAKVVKGWRAFKAEGPLDLTMTGVIASLTGPLAAAGVSVFTLSTYDTDYLLVMSESLDKVVKVLSGFCTVLT